MDKEAMNTSINDNEEKDLRRIGAVIAASNKKADENNNEYEDDKKIAQELVDKLESMHIDANRKLERAKEQLIEKLDILSAKYRTANGVKAAMDTIYELLDHQTSNVFDVMSDANIVAQDLSDRCLHLKEKAQSLGYMELKDLTDDEYDEDAAGKSYGVCTFAAELMTLELLSNIGPNAEDIAEFYDHTQDEMDTVRDELAEMVKKHPEFEDLEPSAHEED